MALSGHCSSASIIKKPLDENNIDGDAILPLLI
jgi:hypothetical protein